MDFFAKQKDELAWWLILRKINRGRGLLKRNNAIAGKLRQVELWLIVERHKSFGTKRRFVDLLAKFLADMR